LKRREVTVTEHKPGDQNETVSLLEKILVFQLYKMGVPQDRIAKTVARQKAWVNELVRGIPKGGTFDGDQGKNKRRKR
jgi:hypothetical protein